MTDLTAGSESRALHFRTGGNDENNGTTYNLALAEPNKALANTLALIPAPGAGNQATIINLGGGGFVATLDQLDSIILRAGGSTFNSESGSAYGLSMGSSSNSDITTWISTVPGSTPIVCEGSTSRSGLDYKFLGNFIPGGVTFDISTTGDDIFTNGGQISAPANGIGFRDISPNTSVHISNHNLIDMIGDNAIGAVFGGANSIKDTGFNAIIFRNGFTGTKGLVGAGLGNETVIARGSRIVASVAIEVPSGADWTVNTACVEGDIDVFAGGVLYVDITKHLSGVVNNSGVINGRIGSVLYGTWAAGLPNQFISNTIVDGKVKDGSFEDYGRLTIDGAADTIDEIRVSYYQDTNNARTVDFQLIDADTLAVYLSGSSPVNSSKDTFFFDVPTALPGFPASSVNLIMQLRASGNKIEAGSVNIYFTRTP